MAIEVNGKFYRTLADEFFLDHDCTIKVYKALVNGVQVYPDGGYPDAIKIIQPPNKTAYTLGETIDYTGIVVQLMVGGIVYRDARYPDGIIPFGELIFPAEKANPDEYRTEPGTYNQYPTETFVYGRNATPGWGSPYWHFIKTEGDVRVVFLRHDYETIWDVTHPMPSEAHSYYEYVFGKGGKYGDETLRADWQPPTPTIDSMRTVGTEDAIGYTDGDMWGGVGPWGPPDAPYHLEVKGRLAYEPMPDGLIDSGKARAYALRLAYGDLAVDPGLYLPVQWKSVYEDKTFEDEFEIEVTV